jgi:hypothetical protein
MHRESVWAAHSLSFSGARCFLSHSHQVGILFFFLFSFLLAYLFVPLFALTILQHSQKKLQQQWKGGGGGG